MRKILVVTQSKETCKVLQDMLTSSLFKLHAIVSTAHEAKALLRQQEFDLCIIQPPLKDEVGLRSVKEIAYHGQVGVLLLVKNDVLDQTWYQVREEGIFVLGLPTSKRMLYQAILCLDASQKRLQKAMSELRKTKSRLQEEKILYQAKCTLIENYHWSESKAHHYIEKTAMDTGQKKSEVATAILEGTEQFEKNS